MPCCCLGWQRHSQPLGLLRGALLSPWLAKALTATRAAAWCLAVTLNGKGTQSPLGLLLGHLPSPWLAMALSKTWPFRLMLLETCRTASAADVDMLWHEFEKLAEAHQRDNCKKCSGIIHSTRDCRQERCWAITCQGMLED